MSFDFKTRFKGIISIIGASEVEQETYKKAEEIGELLAKNNYAVSCGGLSGVMEAVCKGAKKENGFTIGIIPYKSKSAANKYVDIAIPVPFSQARNIVVVLSGDAVVAIAGKAGTLTEIALAWLYQKPIIALTGVGGWSSEMAGKKIDDRRNDKIHEAQTPSEVVKLIKEMVKNPHLSRLSNPNDML
ncbi:MAG: TIGR00725 family protein [Candidatus Lokiarchaeota archaeon]|nr:TIGR00725 family protein [Candidatus Lokiarchaeota archaeon]